MDPDDFASILKRIDDNVQDLSVRVATVHGMVEVVEERTRKIEKVILGISKKLLAPVEHEENKQELVG